MVLVLVLERHIQVVSESDHNNLIIILSLRSESDHLQCLIRSHFRSCSGDLKPAEEKEDEAVYVQVANMIIDQLLITKKHHFQVIHNYKRCHHSHWHAEVVEKKKLFYCFDMITII